MRPYWHEVNNSTFLNGQITDVVITKGYSFEVANSWTIKPRGLTLDPINVSQLLQVFVSEVLICLDN